MNTNKRSEKIIDQLDSPDPNERISVLSCIAVERTEGHLEKIIEIMLQDQVDEVRNRAAFALDSFNDSKALPALIKAIHDPSWGVRSSAGWALVHLGEIVRNDVENILENSTNFDAREMAQLILDRL
jgi:HEAT repeat protein